MFKSGFTFSRMSLAVGKALLSRLPRAPFSAPCPPPTHPRRISHPVLRGRQPHPPPACREAWRHHLRSAFPALSPALSTIAAQTLCPDFPFLLGGAMFARPQSHATQQGSALFQCLPKTGSLISRGVPCIPHHHLSALWGPGMTCVMQAIARGDEYHL